MWKSEPDSTEINTEQVQISTAREHMIPTPLDFPTGIFLLGAAATEGNPQSLQIIWGATLFLAGVIFGSLTLGWWLKSRSARRSADMMNNLPNSSLSRTPKLIFARYESGDKLVYISPGVEALTGICPEDLISGKTRLHSLIHELDRHLSEQAATSRSQLNPESIQYQCRIRTPEGNWRWMHVEQMTILDNHGRPRAYETIFQDITDQYRLQEKTLEQLKLQKLRSSALEHIVTAEDLPVGFEPTLDLITNYFPLEHASILEIDFDSHSAREITGNSAGAEEQVSSMLPLQGKVAENWMQRIQGGEPMMISPRTIRNETTVIRHAFEANMNFSMLILPLMVNGKVEHAIYLQENINGRQWSPEERAVLQTIAQAASRRIEQISANQERENFARLRHNLERSESIAHMTSGIVHDFNNLIFAISGRVALLLRKTDDGTMKSGLEEIRNSVNDASNVIRRLLDNDASSKQNFKPFNPWDLARQASQTAERLLPRRTRLDIETTPEEGQGNEAILANPQTIQQLTLNLVVNARDAAGNNGHIRIRAHLDHNQSHFIIQVEDNGPGIPTDQREVLMKPFVSTKNGTGLGLSICRRVVEEAGGTIELGQSDLGGLMATASFPLISESAETSQTEHCKPSTGIIGRILVVEDNHTIRDVLVRTIQAAGGSVTALENAINVEKVMNDAESRFDLLIFDIDLPERTGVECLTDLRASGDETPCLLITGGTTEPPQFENIGFLRKPFRMETLLECCKDLIDIRNDD